ncbi:type II secretion system protein N [Pleionea sediminis]|uniref:type II secretion system protein N n=1 Tax=Pleionea sediminis TaxID=2569479 RepID=UPI001185DEC7|nr:type II secretion system protein N [Pleionea sediminis]
MTKKTLFLSVLLFLIFLIATVPARTVVNLLPESLPVKASGISGSLWSGSAASLQINRQGISNVEWSLNPIWLFTGKIGGSISMDDDNVSADGGWKVGFDETLYLSNMNVKLPADKLSGYLPMQGMRLSGDFRLEINNLSFNEVEGPKDVSANIYWMKGAASIAGPIIDLGDFTLAAESKDDSKIEIVVKPSKNVLDAQGSAVVNWPEDVALDISVTENVPEQLKSTIAFLKKSDNNRRTLQMTLPLRR